MTPAQVRRHLALAREQAREDGRVVTGWEVDGARLRVFTAPLSGEAPAANDQTDELAALAARIGDASRRA